MRFSPARIVSCVSVLVGVGFVSSVCGVGAAARSFDFTDELPPVAMPLDRAADSYVIYGQLLPVDEFTSIRPVRKLWLVRGTTTTLVPPDRSCAPASQWELDNPHLALSAPPGREQDYAELMEDFDLHCHERVLLTADLFHLSIPFRVLDAEGARRFQARVAFVPGTAAATETSTEFAGASGLHEFSEVYFNAHHTVAMVYSGQWCGSLCGDWSWVVLERRTDGWHNLPWVHTHSMS